MRIEVIIHGQLLSLVRKGAISLGVRRFRQLREAASVEFHHREST